MLKLVTAVLILLNFTGWLWWSAQVTPPRQEIEQQRALPEKAKSLVLVSELAKEQLLYKKQVSVVADGTAELAVEAKQALTSFPLDILISSEQRIVEPELMPTGQSEAESPFSGDPTKFAADCITLGPFQETALADKVERELLEFQLSAERITNETLENSRYWVLLAPGVSQSESENIRDSLKKQGVEFFVIGAGEYAGYLSAGYFEKQENAQNRLEALGRLREEAFIREISTHKTEYWLKAKPENPQQAAKLVQFQRVNPLIQLYGCGELADMQ